MTLRQKVWHIIFESDDRAGKLFDVVLLWMILASIAVVILESIPEYRMRFYEVFFVLEWTFTILFTIEYLLRIWSSPKPWGYIFSFWGIVDLAAVVPTYISLLIAGSHYLMIIRIFRLLRVFRIMKLVRFSSEAQYLIGALGSSMYKIGVFLVAVLSTVLVIGTLMYVVEGPEAGFTSIPESLYWAIVTVTTVGYGDITPLTTLGKMIASLAMITGYAIIAVPTGIVTVAMANAGNQKKICANCSKSNPVDANFCNKCGIELD